MKTFFRGQTARLMITLMTLASSALIIEAGQRWHS
jgi:hypothetical protein